jgi:hypothetical protein
VTVLDVVRFERLVQGWPGAPGRPPAERPGLARAFIAKAVFSLATAGMLIERLQADRTLRLLTDHAGLPDACRMYLIEAWGSQSVGAPNGRRPGGGPFFSPNRRSRKAGIAEDQNIGRTDRSTPPTDLPACNQLPPHPGSAAGRQRSSA